MPAESFILGLILSDPKNAIAKFDYQYALHDAKYLLASDVGLITSVNLCFLLLGSIISSVPNFLTFASKFQAAYGWLRQRILHVEFETHEWAVALQMEIHFASDLMQLMVKALSRSV